MKKKVYFIQSTNKLVKIGLTNNINLRVKQLQTGSPGKLKLLGYIEVKKAAKKEKELHKKYKMYRVSGEWFNLSEEQVYKELGLNYKPDLKDFGSYSDKGEYSENIIGHSLCCAYLEDIYVEKLKKGDNVHSVVREALYENHYVVYTYSIIKGTSAFRSMVIDEIPDDWIKLT